MSNKRAWLKLYVKSLDSAVWQNKTLWRVWSWALLRANHFPAKALIDGKEVELHSRVPLYPGGSPEVPSAD